MFCDGSIQPFTTNAVRYARAEDALSSTGLSAAML
jgi:hypothetical protein